MLLDSRGKPITPPQTETGKSLQAKWMIGIGQNQETGTPVVGLLAPIHKDGQTQQIQVVIDNPPFAPLASILQTLQEAEQQAVEAEFVFEESEVAKTAKRVAAETGRKALTKFKLEETVK